MPEDQADPVHLVQHRLQPHLRLRAALLLRALCLLPVGDAVQEGGESEPAQRDGQRAGLLPGLYTAT